MRYVFQWDFGFSEGKWAKGDVVAFEPEYAAWINRCSPGVLVEEVVDERAQEPAKDRQHRGASNRSAGA